MKVPTGGEGLGSSPRAPFGRCRKGQQIRCNSGAFLTLAYSTADAAYVQPFDDLKLPLNIVAGWLVFGYAPAGYLWLGAIVILAASQFIMRNEMKKERGAT